MENQEWLEVPTIARKVGIRPTRRAYTYLLHLLKLKLIDRAKDPTGKLHYRITQRGLDRLQRLRSLSPPNPLQGFAAQFLDTVRPSQ